MSISRHVDRHKSGGPEKGEIVSEPNVEPNRGGKPGVNGGQERLVGRSREWKDVLKKAAQVASTDTTVLLTGESGTGKEVIARFIHQASSRRHGRFVALNCAALPETLLESELFGYERGAFTGAEQAKPGQIELASGGVLFLDEVSEMSPSAQAKFLRVLQERGEFREDLYYRVQVFEVHLPPLRDRRGDILLLSNAFLDEIGKSFRRPPAGLTEDARLVLARHDWPGNVRELHNALERAAILSEGGLITPEHLPLPAVPRPHRIGDLNVVERETIAQVMRDSGGNKSRAARRLGVSRQQLYVRLRKYDLDAGAEPGTRAEV